MAKRYTVSAKTRVLGNEPGATFEADLSPVQEERLLQSGALRIAAPDGAGTTAAPEAAADHLTPAELDELQALDRPDLDEIAEEMGIEGAADLPSEAAVIDAIAAQKGGSTEGASQHG